MEEAKQIPFFALKYEFVIVENFGNSLMRHVRNALEICSIFESLEKLILLSMMRKVALTTLKAII